MLIRLAELTDLSWLTAHDRHIAWEECERSVRLRRVLVLSEADGGLVGWLRWNLFWDNTPFMNMLYLLPESRRQGHGSALVAHWEGLMAGAGYRRVLTSTQADEEGQRFYRRLGYRDAGALFLPGEAAELIFMKDLTADGGKRAVHEGE